MSSDDSGFDKEAEREKLREKYGDDQEDRENTRRMSELLLQGATMTGKHCDECGDPIFRYDGQEFCPTCQHAAQQAQSPAEAETETVDASQKGGSDDRSAEAESVEQPTTDAGRPDERDDREGAAPDRSAGTDGEPRVEINDVRVADRHADQSDARRPPSQTGDDARSREGSRPESARDRAGRDAGRSDRGRATADRPGETRDRSHARAERHAPDASGRGDTARDAGDLADARGALVRKLSTLARRAEETDDVARARELLAATREAAEALAALDRANR